MKYIIEHLEPTLSKWVMLEYEHISKIVGKENLIITNIKRPSDRVRLSSIAAEVEEKSVKERDLSKACVLDPMARVTLAPEDKAKFDYIVIGGVLGEDPMIGRTRRDITSKVIISSRSLGPMQMSTDNAAYVAKEILEKGKRFEEIPFIDRVSIPIEEGLDLMLPYRYVKINGKPLMPVGLVAYLKKRKTI